MNGQRSRKLLYFTGLYLVSVPLTSAQDTIGGNQGIQDSLLEFINTILVFNIDSVQGVLLYFLAPIAGFYFVQKNMLSYGFELFEERIDRQTYGRTDDDIPNGIKGLSIVTSFITVQMLGRVSPGILFATALISILLGALMQLGLLQEMGGGGSSSSSGSSSTGSSSGGSGNTGGQGGGQSQSGGSNVNWGQLGQTAANFANNVSQNQKKKQNQSIKDALSVFSSGTDIIDAIDHYPSDFRNHVQRINNEKKGDESDVKSVEKVLDRMEHIESEMEDLETRSADDMREANSGNLDWGADSEIHDKMNSWNNDMRDQLRNLKQELERVKKDEKNSITPLRDQIDKSWENIQLYIRIHKFAEKLPGGPRKVANDNDLLNKLVNEARNRNLAGSRSASATKSQFKSKLENIDKWESQHKNIINDFEKEVEDELKIKKTEAEDLKQISSDDDKIRGAAQTVKSAIGQMQSSGSLSNTGTPPWTPDNVKNRMNKFTSLGKKIDDEVQDIYNIAQSEGEFENETLKKLRELYN
ncbi:hypothetical protein AQV86_05680 [Nanohaloarchaea archaeon SG9]|nr:hypothetical protein AQV86_05680 [Nanohaloarchaea archaeon SG9]